MLIVGEKGLCVPGWEPKLMQSGSEALQALGMAAEILLACKSCKGSFCWRTVGAMLGVVLLMDLMICLVESEKCD